MPLEDDDIKKMEKELDKDLRALISPSKKTWALVMIASLAVVAVSSIQGFNSSWAREIARSIITADGLLLGFVILGATVFSRANLARTAYEQMVRKAMTEFLERTSKTTVINTSIEEYLKREFEQVIGKPAYVIGTIQGSLYSSAIILLFSIGSAFGLYGVGDSTVSIPLRMLFLGIYTFSFTTLILGAYLVIGSTFAIITRGSSIGSGKDTKKLIMEIIDEKIKEEEEKKGDGRSQGALGKQ